MPEQLFSPPSTCPCCGAATEMDGEYLVCPNTAECPAQAVGRLKRYVAAMGVKEWGDTLLDRLVELGLVATVPDLYRLTEDQLAGMDRMGKRSAAKVVKTLRDKSKVTLDVLLEALSIPLCASSTVKMAMDAGIDTFDKFKAATVAQLTCVEGIGPVKATSIVTWMQSTSSDVVAQLLELGVQVQGKVHGSLTGSSVCFTGASTRPRTELEKLVKGAGGEVKNSVVKKLTYLVMADPSSTSSKAQAARKNGTKCITEDELLALIGA